jgi:putative ABC transport system permease protein
MENDGHVESFLRINHVAPFPIVEGQNGRMSRFPESKFLFVDSNFYSFFSFHLKAGNAASVLSKPFSIVITERTARKYFGTADPIGKTLRYNDSYNFVVTGVAQDPPSNSSIDFDITASLSSMNVIQRQLLDQESSLVQAGTLFRTYFLLKDRKFSDHLCSTLTMLHKRTAGQEDGETYLPIKLSDLHLHDPFAVSANVKYVGLFPLIAMLILALALSNYVSLSTACATLRAKEIGVRKVAGAKRKDIVIQFLVESAVSVTIAFVLAAGVCLVVQPAFFDFLQLHVDRSFLWSGTTLAGCLMLLIVTTMLASFYPCLLLSGFMPADVLYGKGARFGGGLLRKVLMFFQFAICVGLLIFGYTTKEQVFYLKNHPTGINKLDILMIPFSPTTGRHYHAVMEDFRQMSGIRAVSIGGYPLYGGYDVYFTRPANAQKDIALNVMSVDSGFLGMMGLKWAVPLQDLEGKGGIAPVVLNEMAVSLLNSGSTPGTIRFSLANKACMVRGVVKNFNFESLQKRIGPFCFRLVQDIGNDSLSRWASDGGCLFVKYESGANIPVLIKDIERILKKYDPENSFVYSFMDESFDHMYNAEDHLSKITATFSFFTFLIACLGLIALSVFNTQKRVKEIGIRKVLGCGSLRIVFLLLMDHAKLIALSLALAIPVAWLICGFWLDNFAYRIENSWVADLSIGLGTIFIAIVPIFFQSLRAALSKPVTTLRQN